MSRKPDHYHPLSIWLHWLAFLLFIIVIASIELRGFTGKGTPLRQLLFQVHVISGQLIFLVTLLRLAIRLGWGAPEATGDNPLLLLAAKAVHVLLYLLMGSMIFSGMGGMLAGGREVAFLGLPLPQLIAPNDELRFLLRTAHTWAGNGLIALVGLHGAAALWHHFILKDGLLLKMHPPKK